jgi:hypothetical protein
MNEDDLYQINENKMVLYTVLDRIEVGIYPPFPTMFRIWDEWRDIVWL